MRKTPLLLLLLLPACARHAPDPEPAAPARRPAEQQKARKKVYERAELEKKVAGLTPEAFRDLLGDPDEYVQRPDDDLYTYKQIARHPNTRQLEDVTVICPRGRAAFFVYSGDPPLRGDDPSERRPVKIR